MPSPGKPEPSRRRFWCLLLAAIIAAGILSRSTHTGFRLLDKYLGDALYAAMVYALFRLSGRVTRVALWASLAMLAIECFQLTGLPSALLRSPHAPLRLAARLLGTQFSFADLAAYAAGIAALHALNARTTRHMQNIPT
jgi:hypothetical protein